MNIENGVKKNNLKKGYFGIGIHQCKKECNIGTLFRSAVILWANFVFTIGKEYKWQRSDTIESYKYIPLFNFKNFETFQENRPLRCKLVGVEINEKSEDLCKYQHTERSIYLLGSEDSGLPDDILKHCQSIVQLPGDHCLNVATCGSIVMYDRIIKNDGVF